MLQNDEINRNFAIRNDKQLGAESPGLAALLLVSFGHDTGSRPKGNMTPWALSCSNMSLATLIPIIQRPTFASRIDKIAGVRQLSANSKFVFLWIKRMLT